MIVPVLDLMIGQVVLAQGGDRAAYRPVQSRLTHSSQPLDVAKAMFNQTGCDWLYLADIDSFAGAAPSWRVYDELLDHGFGLWIDANWIQGDRYREIETQLQNRERLKIIVSSETLSSMKQFSIFAGLLEQGISPIFSLDRKGDTVIMEQGELADCPPLELIQSAFSRGVNEFIVLDLCQVGTRAGCPSESSTASLIEELRSEQPDLVLTSGGGVRNAEDVRHWMKLGCNHVLVASAIHDCALTPDEVSRLR